jgi:hypothetical protein
MSPGGEKLRLREVYYHHRLFAPTAASEVTNVTRARARAFHWNMFDSSQGGDNGSSDLIPLLGDKQEL